MLEPTLVSGPNSENPESSEGLEEGKSSKSHRPLSFWLVFVGLCATGLISALDGSVLSTALPSIIEDLNGGDNYVWVVNVYFLTSAAFQPLYGQLANLWGRRYLMIGVTCIFVLGSGLCGGATSMNMLIGARAVQGIGAGGINMLIDLIVCDLVPMRERASLMGLLFLSISIGTALGPFIGGVLTEQASWRWIFYINLPLGGVALLLLVLFLQVQWKSEGTTMDRLKRVDFPGNAILMASTFSILWALTYGGTRYSWSAVNVLAPLIIGFAGFGLFFLFEMSRFCAFPVMPTEHFGNRTSCAAFFISFMCMTITFWVIYFYPVYFQAVLGTSVTKSGVNLIAVTLGFPIFAAVGGAAVTATGRYKPVHIFAGAVLTLGMGLSSILNQNTHAVVWAVFEVILAIGMGLMISTTLQAVQAGLPESEVGLSTGTWSFIRSLGIIWGVAIPGAIFNSRFNQLSGQIDISIRDSFTNGKAYQHASAGFVNSFPPQFRLQIIDVYVGALKRVWLIGIVFTAITFLAAFMEKEIELRTSLDTDFGLKNGNKEKAEEEAQSSGERPVELSMNNELPRREGEDSVGP